MGGSCFEVLLKLQLVYTPRPGRELSGVGLSETVWRWRGVEMFWGGGGLGWVGLKLARLGWGGAYTPPPPPPHQARPLRATPATTHTHSRGEEVLVLGVGVVHDLERPRGLLHHPVVEAAVRAQPHALAAVQQALEHALALHPLQLGVAEAPARWVRAGGGAENVCEGGNLLFQLGVAEAPARWVSEGGGWVSGWAEGQRVCAE